MFIRIAILFLPSLIGLLWQDDSALSIAWSLGGSLFIAGVSLSFWFRQSAEDPPLSHQLLRPTFMYHFFFLGYHVLGGAVNALDIAGYTIWGRIAGASEYELSLNATAQALMLLAHASVTAGMKLANFRYKSPKYIIAYLPPYRLLVLSLICLGLGTVFSLAPGLFNLGDKLLQISSTAVLLEVVIAIWRRNFKNLAWATCLLSVNLLSQILSGWKGLALWTIVILGGLLYPLMPRRVLLGGTAFVLLWALFLHPFGLALRPLLWYEGVDRESAVAYSMDEAINMSFAERLDNLWALMSGRANELHQFRRYLEYVPSVHPYFGLKLVIDAHVALVPRILWPEKPDLEHAAMQLVYDAGVVSEQSTVSAKSNFYQDAYLSGGWPIVTLASLLLGFLSMVISRVCEWLFGGYEIGTCLVYASLFTQAFITPPNFLFFVGTVWSSLIVMFAAFFVAKLSGWIVPAQASVRATLPEATVIGHPTV